MHHVQHIFGALTHSPMVGKLRRPRASAGTCLGRASRVVPQRSTIEMVGTAPACRPSSLSNLNLGWEVIRDARAN